MNVSPNQPFRLIYSLFQHEYLGYLFESFVVALGEHGELTLRYQNISAKNAPEFAAGLDEQDYELIKLMDSMQQDVVVKRFHTRKISPADFFLSVYDKERGNKALQQEIDAYLERRRSKIMALIGQKPLYTMARDGNPADEFVEVQPEKASIWFHFSMEPEGTHYYPTIFHQGERLLFQHRNARIICKEPGWMLVDGKLYSFLDDPDGNKLRPFLNKNHISIPKKMEEEYFRKFVAPLIESFDVKAKGFEIKEVHSRPSPTLSLSVWHPSPVPTLFGEGEEEGEDAPSEAMAIFSLSFKYSDHSLRGDKDKEATVRLEKQGEREYVFYRVTRDLQFEKDVRESLAAWGLTLREGRASVPKNQGISWLNEQLPRLAEKGIAVKQESPANGPQYFIGQAQIEVSILEQQDWFDVHAVVKFGDHEVRFVDLRKLILSGKREFALPDGRIAVIPEAWLAKYSDLLHFVDEHEGGHILRKHHLALVQELSNGNLATVTIGRKLERLREFEHIEDYEVPAGFGGTLRPYQKAGYNWLRFLNQYGFGGCLADDMGLGKTVQTLALLQSERERQAPETPRTSLLIMPTSLLYNWEMEARKFTPELQVYSHTGTNRDKDVSVFAQYDVVLTSYGIARIDIDLLERYLFNYVILDESQVIKNPASNIAHAVRRLQARRRLVLSGTPLENSTMDLWSQLSFANPGLLGTQAFFRKEFQLPIEKRQDEARSQRLHALIKPFILRRHKSHVATELPAKIEQVKYCQMSAEQEALYEETKSYYRNKILSSIDGQGMAKSQFMLLQGLTMLRQIANHPRLVKPEFEGESGKMEDVLHMLESGLVDNHKILIFSQFVKHLQLFRHRVEAMGISYAYLDGSVKDRQAAVEQFQHDEGTRLFLISLRAGGLGLNLTAADYVFLLDPWWNPAIEAQAVDRAHRIGQQNTVFTYKFISRGTVEEKIIALQQRKLELASSLVATEESFIKSLTRDDIASLLA